MTDIHLITNDLVQVMQNNTFKQVHKMLETSTGLPKTTT